MIVGITRVRNEALIIEDTLRHALDHVDRVALYDDVSTDATPEIASDFDRVTVIRGTEWRADRRAEETRHRALLLDAAKATGAEWSWCFDADERLMGEFPTLDADAYRFRLFDGYLTAEHDTPYQSGPLAELPRMWGPEYRDIIMLFRIGAASYRGPDRREPVISGWVHQSNILVRHYGKCLSVQHWEDTCDYYAEHWPEPYRSKWVARRGKAIHTQSDFGRPLFAWDEAVKNGVKL